jgi:GAF domain-containing protein
VRPPPDPNERARISYLHACQILDSPREDHFDEIVEEAARRTQCPTVLISLLDTERQWFKSKVGLKCCETPIEISFCAHAILEPEPLVVEDATQDLRFVDSPLVTDDPRIRFYAGVSLKSPQGVPYGTLCAVDYVPRKLTPEQMNSLVDLAHKIESLIELRKLTLSIRQQKQELEEKVERLAALSENLAS